MARVFLSYTREDAEAAEQLAARLAEAGHDVWWDRHVHGGERFSDEIDQALKNAEVITVLWTAASVSSAWVQDEAAEGRDSGRMVPVIVGGVRPPLGFRQYHSIELDGWNGDGDPEDFGELLRAINKCAHKKGQPAPNRRAPEVQGSHSICVLPFANMSGDPEQEYFSDGITEDIITDLSKVSALAVVARNTAFTFKGRAVDVREVARTLGVSNVLKGSVRKAGNRVRVTAQLIDAATSHHLWADRFDRELTDIFAIQDEISNAIVQALRLKLLPAEKQALETRGTSNVDAYNLYLMARQRWITAVYSDPRRAEAIVRMCQQATLIDPNYAQAWALMALAQSELKLWHGKDADPLPAAERALSINPKLPEALAVKAQGLEEAGREDEANKLIETALIVDPESWEVNREAGRMLFRQGRIQKAATYFEKATSMMDTDYHNGAMLMTCYNALRDPENHRRVARMTLERAERAVARDPADACALAYGAAALAHFGEECRAREWIQRALLLDPDNVGMRYNLVWAILGLFDYEGALDVLEPFFEKVVSPTYIRHLEADPDFDSIRDHSRFREMLSAAKQRLGIVAAQD